MVDGRDDGGVVALTPESAAVQFAPLVHKLAHAARRQFPAQTILTHEDLVQEGHIALTAAARAWKPGRGTRFMTYASVAITNRYSKLARRDWRRQGWIFANSDAVLAARPHAAGGPDQEAEARQAVSLRLQATMPDRYRRVRRTRG